MVGLVYCRTWRQPLYRSRRERTREPFQVLGLYLTKKSNGFRPCRWKSRNFRFTSLMSYLDTVSSSPYPEFACPKLP
jgi:hypothetical protein